MPEIHGSLSFSALVLLGAAGSAAFLAWTAYRVTIPPLAPVLRRTLVLLRALSLFLIVLLLGEPVLSIRRHQTEHPGVALLIDNSRSMGLRDRTGDRLAELRGIIGSDAMRRLGTETELHPILFDRRARFLQGLHPDSVTAAGAVTDLAGAFAVVRTTGALADVRAAILLSDGMPTEGPNPVYDAEALGIPVFTVGIGDTAEQRDVVLRSVRTNDLAFVGTKLPVHASIHASGFEGARVDVTLRHGSRVLDHASVTLGGASQDQEVSLTAVPDTDGRQTYAVDVTMLQGELTDRNNRSMVSVDVLRSRMRILVVAGSPGPDEAFLRRSLESDKNLDVRAFTESATGRFVEGTLTPAVLESMDCLVLVGFPRAASDGETVSMLARAIDSGIPVFVVLSRTVDPSALAALAPVLPFRVEDPQSSEVQVFAGIPESKQQHAVLRLPEGSGADVWSRLPPIFRWQSGILAKPEAEVLATVQYGKVSMSEPLILLRNVNRHKSLAVTGYGIWRWKMLGEPASGTDRVYDAFVGNAIRWLTTREERRRVRVQPVRPVFTTAEAAEFTAEVYDESSVPVDHADVTLHVTGSGGTRDVTFEPAGNGLYTASLGPLPEGSYTIRAKASAGGREIGEDTAPVTIGAVTAEFLDTRMNKPLLQSLALKTGGRYFDAGETDDLVRAVRSVPGMSSRDHVLSADTELWHAGWMLAAIVALVAAEWTLRKRYGLM